MSDRESRSSTSASKRSASRSTSSRFAGAARESKSTVWPDAPSDSPLARPIQVLIAHDHPIFRDGLRELLETDPEIDIVGEAANGREAVELARGLEPDILLLDLSLPGTDGMDVLREVSAACGSVRTLLLASGIEKPELLRALRLGARGVVPKDAATQLLFKSIRAVMAGEYWVGRDMVGDLVQLMTPESDPETDRPAPQTFGLTARERDIVGAIVAGYANRDIASKFALSEDTVKHHLTNIFDKTGSSNRLELALFALHHRLVDPD